MNKEKIDTIQNEAMATFNLLQQLQAPMAEKNIVIMNACMGSMKLIGQICEEEKKECKDDAGEADAE